jgi:hypothetical protein
MWKKIQNYEAYSVSDSGEVRNDITGKILKQTIDRDGYHMITLHYGPNGKRRWAGVHRIVAETFIPNPDCLPIVNHKDENKDNNAVDNLEWCSASYSTNYGTRNNRTAKKLSKRVYQYEDGELVGWYDSTKLAGKFLGIGPSHISDCCRGEKKTAGGYKWSYTCD